MAGLKPNKDLMLRHGVDVSHGLKSKEIQKFKSLALDETYQVEYIWDSWAGLAEMKIKALSGAVLMTFNKYPPNVPVLELRGRDYIGVGLSDFYGAVEVPSLGWVYSDLTLELSP